jgi:hypothetical protein
MCLYRCPLNAIHIDQYRCQETKKWTLTVVGKWEKKKKLASYDSLTLYFFCLGRDIEPTINVKRKGKGRKRF